MTNLLFMWLGIKGIIGCRRNQHDQIFLVAYGGYLVVGTGSFLFHSTLKCKFASSRFISRTFDMLEMIANLRMQVQIPCS